MMLLRRKGKVICVSEQLSYSEMGTRHIVVNGKLGEMAMFQNDVAGELALPKELLGSG